MQLKYSRKCWIVICLLLIAGCAITQSRTPLADRLQALAVQVTAVGKRVEKDTLRLVSLNLAHGRHDSFHQLLLSEQTIRTNIDETAAYLKSLDADLVALQEADGPSRWSGGFDHVARLAEQAEYDNYIRAENVNNVLGNYGSGVLSKLPIAEGLSFVFQPSPPTSNKGFSLAQIEWQVPDRAEVKIIDVVSVHLDFSRDSVRKEQIAEIKTILKPRKNSTIVMGDFNSEWLAREYMLEHFAESSPLHVFEPDSKQLDTYGSKRLDWILMTKDLAFVDYRVEDVGLSDHKVVVANIRLQE